MLTDPRAAHAEQNNFAHCLVGLAGLERMVRALADDEQRQPATSREADDFVYLLLALASLGETVGLLARSAPPPRRSADPPSSPTTPGKLLR
jgi:hypothetical protein